MNVPERIDIFLDTKSYGVVGASSNRDKYGNKVLRCYLQNGYRAIPVNPKEKEIEGIPCVASVLDLPDDIMSSLGHNATHRYRKGRGNGHSEGNQEHLDATRRRKPRRGGKMPSQTIINVIADGSCLLVVLGYHEH